MAVPVCARLAHPADGTIQLPYPAGSYACFRVRQLHLAHPELAHPDHTTVAALPTARIEPTPQMTMPD